MNTRRMRLTSVHIRKFSPTLR